MSVDKYKFVSPGVFVKEIDKSELPSTALDIGPVIIGRTERGPAFRPTMVQSMDEFVQIFGEPIPGGRGGDVWRQGNYSSPTYAGFAARAYLKNNGPVTIVRTLGIQDDEASATSKAQGASGWQVSSPGETLSDGGAYGFFLINSGSTELDDITGSLAAIFYLDGCRIALSGTLISNDGTDTVSDSTASNGVIIESVKDGGLREFKIAIETADGGDDRDDLGTHTLHTFNFDRNSDKYIRKVFNTNPIKTNTSTNDTATQEKYWLGETFDNVALSEVTGDAFGLIMPLENSAGTTEGGDFLAKEATSPETGYFFAQDLIVRPPNADNDFVAANQPELFKFVGLATEGEYLQKNIKISVSNIKAPVDTDVDPYGTFSVEIRDIYDTDSRKNVLERFDNLNLNPNSPNYIAAIIGDRYIQWSADERRYKEYNDYANRSKFVRVEMHENVSNGLVDEQSLPFGVKGPLKYKDAILSAAANEAFNIDNIGDTFIGSGLKTSYCNSYRDQDTNQFVGPSQEAARKMLLKFPSIPLRSASNAPENFSNQQSAYFGVDLLRSGSTGTSKRAIDESIFDMVRTKPGDLESFGDEEGVLELMWAFTLDDLHHDSLDAAQRHVAYESGSHAEGLSISAISGGYQNVLDRGFNKFTTVLHGGFDGLDITESDPYRNTLLDGKSATTNYAYASLKRAIDVIKDPEEMDYNIAVMPGITNESLTQDLADVCEDRGDALAIVDLKGGYEPLHEGVPSTYPKLGSVNDTVSNMKARELNSSYACAYYPWIQTKDSTTGQLLWVPPSVVALGTMGSSAADTELWFAPAGFNRGGLSEGSAGITAVSAREKLTSDQRDDLYENRINPIASFPSEGLVIFGQKTTQIKSSALDRINVRRLMIFLKKEISRIANGILFDQNVQTTWDRFTSQANPLLASVKTRFGLEDYKLVLDESTTTPDLRDRNIMYAKVFLKPARAIEFIALDFTIMRSGAAFED
jgi:hypothetical protein